MGKSAAAAAAAAAATATTTTTTTIMMRYINPRFTYLLYLQQQLISWSLHRTTFPS